MSIATMTPEHLAAKCRSGDPVDLIDVRTPVEFGEVHLDAARNVPLDALDPAAIMTSRFGAATDPVYVICRSGGRGKKACEKFHAAGFTNVVNIEGGTMACLAAGMSAVRGAKVMSLERQVRIAAGSLVLVGAVLGWFVDPLFIGLSAFVGAGLVFAGITDTCGMGLMLAKMPWNNVRPSATTCQLEGRS